MLSVCIIVKNEEKNLRKCLQNLVRLKYEFVIVDTGSTDNTKKTAFEFTDRVFDFTWRDDFSAARNFAISKAENDFIMMLDSDEFITKVETSELEKLILQNPKAVGRIHINSVFTRNGMEYTSKDLVSRIFSKKHYKYKGRIHEQITALDGMEFVAYPVPVYVEHCGYDGSLQERVTKAERNTRLLEEALREEGDHPYILYQLGKANYYSDNYGNAVRCFEKALEFDLNPELEYVTDMVEMYGYALLENQQQEQALLLANVYDEFSHSADYVFMMGLVYMQNALFDKAMAEFLKAAKYKECKVDGVNSYSAFYNAGVIMECLDDKGKALEYYERCGDYEPARQGIRRCR